MLPVIARYVAKKVLVDGSRALVRHGAMAASRAVRGHISDRSDALNEMSNRAVSANPMQVNQLSKEEQALRAHLLPEGTQLPPDVVRVRQERDLKQKLMERTKTVGANVSNKAKKLKDKGVAKVKVMATDANTTVSNKLKDVKGNIKNSFQNFKDNFSSGDTIEKGKRLVVHGAKSTYEKAKDGAKRKLAEAKQQRVERKEAKKEAKAKAKEDNKAFRREKRRERYIRDGAIKGGLKDVRDMADKVVGNNFLGNSLAAVGDIMTFSKPKWTKDPEREAMKEGKRRAKRASKFDGNFGVYSNREAHHYARQVRDENALSGFRHNNSDDSVSGGSSGGGSFTPSVSSGGSSGGGGSFTPSSSSGGGASGGGMGGGASIDVSPVVNKIGELRQVDSSILSATGTTNSLLSNIVKNTEDQAIIQTLTGIRGVIESDVGLSKTRNVINTSSDKYLEFIAKKMGLQPPKVKPRRLKALLGMAGLGLLATVVTKFDKIAAWFKEKKDAGIAWFKKLGETETGKKAVAGFNSVKESAKGAFQKVSTEGLSGLKEVGANIWDKTKEAGSNVISAILDKIVAFAKGIVDFFKGLDMGKIKGLFDTMKKGIMVIYEFLETLVKAVWDFFSGIFDSIANIFSGSGLIKTLQDVFNNMFGWIKSIWDTLFGLVKSIGNFLKGFFEGMKEIFKFLIGLITPIIKAVIWLGKLLWKWVIKPLVDFAVFVFKVIGKVFGFIFDIVGSIFGAIGKYIKWLRNSWIGRMLGMNDKSELTEADKVELKKMGVKSSKEDSKSPEEDETQKKQLDELKYSNDQRERIAKRQEDIEKAEREKDRKLQEENNKLLNSINKLTKEDIDKDNRFTEEEWNNYVSEAEKEINKDPNFKVVEKLNTDDISSLERDMGINVKQLAKDKGITQEQAAELMKNRVDTEYDKAIEKLGELKGTSAENQDFEGSFRTSVDQTGWENFADGLKNLGVTNGYDSEVIHKLLLAGEIKADDLKDEKSIKKILEKYRNKADDIYKNSKFNKNHSEYNFETNGMDVNEEVLKWQKMVARRSLDDYNTRLDRSFDSDEKEQILYTLKGINNLVDKNNSSLETKRHNAIQIRAAEIGKAVAATDSIANGTFIKLRPEVIQAPSNTISKAPMVQTGNKPQEQKTSPTVISSLQPSSIESNHTGVTGGSTVISYMQAGADMLKTASAATMIGSTTGQSVQPIIQSTAKQQTPQKPNTIGNSGAYIDSNVGIHLNNNIAVDMAKDRIGRSLL